MGAGGENERCVYCGRYVPDMELHTKKTCMNILDRYKDIATQALAWQVDASVFLNKHIVLINTPQFPQDIEVLLREIRDAKLGGE